ncbi:hypothetical protein DFP72DRAFT_1061923 [Ephemerocybe angulata]|uniref:Uncharacterized protein n=1 Tax=Ephemerocybe angulata TaxID=980116 RepID=A0A8H6IAT8_9AGAR|nr:hypothetical protein DFP72DRAFT_1061923 [Tulosesus angulatus]
MFLQFLYRQVLRPPSRSSSEMLVGPSQATQSKFRLLCGVGGVPDLTTLLHVTTETTESVSETRIKDSVSWYGWRPETANDDEAPIQFSKGKSTRGSQEQRAAFGMSKTYQRQSCQRRLVEERLFSPLLSQYCQAEDLDFCEQEGNEKTFTHEDRTVVVSSHAEATKSEEIQSTGLWIKVTGAAKLLFDMALLLYRKKQPEHGPEAMFAARAALSWAIP